MRILTMLLALLPTLAWALEINTATRAQLEQLQGLGVQMTERILQARGERPFADWSDFAQRVQGIGGKRAEQLHRQGLTVNGKPLPGRSGDSK